MQDNHAAYILYQDGASLKDIAAILKVDVRSVQRWKAENNWDEKVKELAVMENDISDFLLHITHTQVKSFKDGNVALDATEADSLAKIINSWEKSKKKDTWITYNRVINRFLKYLNAENPQVAQSVTDYVMPFVQRIKSEQS